MQVTTFLGECAVHILSGKVRADMTDADLMALTGTVTASQLRDYDCLPKPLTLAERQEIVAELIKTRQHKAG